MVVLDSSLLFEYIDLVNKAHSLTKRESVNESLNDEKEDDKSSQNKKGKVKLSILQQVKLNFPAVLFIFFIDIFFGAFAVVCFMLLLLLV